MPIRVLIIDDSRTVQKILAMSIARDPEIEVVGAAGDPYEGRDMIIRLEPDVVLLDVEMPRMDGITFLGKLMVHHPMPVIIVSTLTPQGGDLAVRALQAGAFDVVHKPDGTHSTLQDLTSSLIAKIKVAHGARTTGLHKPLRSRPMTSLRPSASIPAGASGYVRNSSMASPPGAAMPGALAVTGGTARPLRSRIVAIGASTGGTRALEEIVQKLPADSPGIVVVQHMPELFTAPFAQRLDELSPMTVREGRDGEPIVRGTMLVAPGGRHMRVEPMGREFRVVVFDDEPVGRHRPAVDVLFFSMAKYVGPRGLGILLTGMGKDGAAGLWKMREAGCRTLAQDEATSVVYGMPQAAVQIGAAEAAIPLDEVVPSIVRFQREAASPKSAVPSARGPQ